MENILEQLQQSFQDFSPSIFKAIILLVVGWIVALVVAALVRAGLRRTQIDNRIAAWVFGEQEAKKMDVERWISRGVYFILLLFVLVAFLDTLQFTIEPLNRFLGNVFEYIPRLFAAAGILFVAWIIAAGSRFLLKRALARIKADEKLGAHAQVEGRKKLAVSDAIADTVYWLIFLLAMPAVLSSLAIEGLLGPVQRMTNEFLGFLPNLIAAGMIVLLGWFFARVTQRIVTNLLAALGTDRLGEVSAPELLGKQRLSNLVGLAVYVMIFIPVIIAALNALKLDAITAPASEMLNTILQSIPDLIAAVLVLVVAYIVGNIMRNLTARLLTASGFNSLVGKLGMAKTADIGPKSPASVAGTLVLVAIMFFASIEASRQIGFDAFSEMLAQFTLFGGRILLGLAIFAVGLYLGNLASKAIHSSGARQAGLLSNLARYSILVLAGAMALKEMGLADEIVNIAFGLLFGSIAVAFAVAFGLGGKDIASKELTKWITSLREKK